MKRTLAAALIAASSFSTANELTAYESLNALSSVERNNRISSAWYGIAAGAGIGIGGMMAASFIGDCQNSYMDPYASESCESDAFAAGSMVAGTVVAAISAVDFLLPTSAEKSFAYVQTLPEDVQESTAQSQLFNLAIRAKRERLVEASFSALGSIYLLSQASDSVLEDAYLIAGGAAAVNAGLNFLLVSEAEKAFNGINKSGADLKLTPFLSSNSAGVNATYNF